MLLGYRYEQTCGSAAHFERFDFHGTQLLQANFDPAMQSHARPLETQHACSISEHSRETAAATGSSVLVVIMVIIICKYNSNSSTTSNKKNNRFCAQGLRGFNTLRNPFMSY